MLWLAALLLARAAAQDLVIGVVEQPVRALQLAAAVDAALNSTGAADVAPLEPGEPLAPPAAVCRQGAGGAVAAVGGGGARAARLAAAGAARAALPLLLVDHAPADATWEALELYPHPQVLAQACAELCVAKGWQRSVLLHEEDARGAALLTASAAPLQLLARQLPPRHEDALLRNLLLVLKKSGLTNFIVWCDAACTVRVLDAAQRVGLLAEKHSYIALSLDLHTQPLSDYSHGGANITGLRLFDPESDEVAEVMRQWRRMYTARLGGAGAGDGDGDGETQGEEPEEPEEVGAIAAAPPTALLLAHLGTRLAAEAWRRLALPPAAPADCDAGAGAFHADTLLNYLRSEEWSSEDGVGRLVGGAMSWEADGGRREVQLELVELARGGRLQRAGLWAPRAGVTWLRQEAPAAAPPPDSMTNRTFTILIAKNPPYVMMQESMKRLTGNDRYEGFCIELIQLLAKQLHFNYTFVESEEGGYGTIDNKTGKWVGMLGRLMEDESIDFAITDLTITAERESAVDFTTPFMNLGISILFRTPKQPEPKTFAFLLPFSNEVWLCLGFAYLGTSLLLYVVGRLCHEEWQNPYPCIEDPPALENQFTLANALWFNLGAVLLQGSEIAPVAYSTRAVASVWWLFALVITSSYTANLATLLAKKSSDQIITNVQDLADNQLGIDYGAKAGGSTYTFFEHSQSELYQRMFKYMQTRKMPGSNVEGIKKVMTENYAFLMESTTIDYETERNCDVTKVGSLLDSKGYGIAMKKNSQFRQAMNLGLLNLQESGKLREMQHTWWKEKHGGGACTADEEHESEELSMKNFLGLWLVLVIGCALGIVLSCCDLAWTSWQRARDNDERFHQRFWSELRFVFRFDQSVKPLQGPLSGSSSESAQSAQSAQSAHSARLARSVEAEAEAEPRSASPSLQEAARARSGSGPRRRRSSMHAASVRLARHAHRDSDTPARR